MAIKTIMDSTLTAIADAIRAKTGKSASMTPLEMPEEINDIQGDDKLANDLMAGTASGDIVLHCSENRPAMSIRIMPTQNGCNYDITSLELPGLVLASESFVMFYNGAASYCKLRSVKCPDLEKAGYFGGNYTHYIDALEEVYFPKLKSMPQRFLKNAISLPEFLGDSVIYVNSEVFSGCTALEYVDLGKSLVGQTITGTNSIGGSAFLNSALKALVLRQDTQIMSLVLTNALSGTPIASGTGYIYVPRALVDTYKAATNWVTYATQFRALEDYTSDGTLTGDFVMPA